MSKGSQLLEVFAIEIQMCIAKKSEIRRMKRIYTLAQKFSSTIADPRVIGIIKECGGKMYMSEKKWQRAFEEFQESFNCLVECGSSNARTLLKYVIWTAMLAKIEFDATSTQQAQIYRSDDLIIGMAKLRTGFETNNLELIQELMRSRRLNLMADPYIANYADDLLRSLHLKSLVDICKPYKSVKLSFLAQRLDIDEAQVRSLLSELIIEEQIKGQIDQINGTLEIQSTERLGAMKQKAML